MGEVVETPTVVAVPNTPPPPHPGVGRGRAKVLFALPLVLMAATWGGGAWLYLNMPSEPPPPVAAAPDGPRLFVQHCAYCHGEQGNGRGVAGLNPPARYFGKEAFRFGSTANGIPTDADLMRTLHRGLPGSAMPAFDHLPDEDRAAIVGHVRTLVTAGIFERLRIKDGEDFDPAAGWRIATTQSQVGAPLTIPVAAHTTTPATLELGKKIFLQTCANCHGKEGRGDGEQTKDPKFVTDNGTRAVPRDLTQGVFKAGREREQLYARILLGIPGTPMPATTNLKPDEVHSLIDHVLSLSEKTIASAPDTAAVAVK